MPASPPATVTHRFTSEATTRLGQGLLLASATFAVIVTVVARTAPVATALGLVSAAGVICVAVRLILVGRTGITVRAGTLYAWTRLRRHRIPLDDIASFATTPTGAARDGLAVTARLRDGRALTFAEPISPRPTSHPATGARTGTTIAEQAATRLTHLLAQYEQHKARGSADTRQTPARPATADRAR